MLAFESAWRVLSAEHAQMRDLVLELQRDAQGGRWRTQTAARAELLCKLQTLQVLDSERHRPKGIALVEALRGKSAETDALLESLEAAQAQCDGWLHEALALIGELEAGGQAAEAELDRVLD